MVPPTRHSADADKWTVDALAEPRTIVLISARFAELSLQIGDGMKAAKQTLDHIYLGVMRAGMCLAVYDGIIHSTSEF